MMKFVYITLAILVAIALFMAGYVWHTLQSLPTIDATGAPRNEVTTPATGSGGGGQVAPVSGDSIIVEKASLPESQQKVLETFGVEGDSIVITPAMQDCAKKAIGEARLQEIVDGAAPTPFEALSLGRCL